MAYTETHPGDVADDMGSIFLINGDKLMRGVVIVRTDQAAMAYWYGWDIVPGSQEGDLVEISRGRQTHVGRHW